MGTNKAVGMDSLSLRILGIIGEAKAWRYTRGIVADLAGQNGDGPSIRKVAYRLTLLEDSGLVERVRRKTGPYGFGWRITEQGRGMVDG